MERDKVVTKTEDLTAVITRLMLGSLHHSQCDSQQAPATNGNGIEAMMH